MEQLATLGVAVIEHVVVSQLAEELVVEIEARRQVVIVVQRNFQQRHTGQLGARHFAEDVVAIKGNMVHPGTAVTGQRMGNGGVAVFRNVQRQAQGAALAAQGAALDQAVRVGQHHLVVGGEIEQALVEQHPAVQRLGWQRQGHVVDAAQATGGGHARVQAEVGVIQGMPGGALLYQVQQTAIGCAYRWHLALVGTDQAAERLATVGSGTLERSLLVLDPQRGGAQ